MSVRSLRYNTILQHFTKSALASTDRDALAFLEAAQIYNTNDQRAIVNLVRSLKRTGLWSKMAAIYPLIGGTASSHKWNLKDPRDVDAAFRLVFSGGWTHNSNGIIGNGTNSFADTKYNGLSSGSRNNWSRSIYSRTSTNTQTQIECGSAEGSGSTFRSDSIGTRQTDGNAYHGDTGTNASILLYSNSNGSGYYLTVRRGSNDTEAYKNGTSQQTGTTASENLPNANFYIGARNYVGTLQFPTTRNLAFATIGDGLTDAEATTLYNIVDLYQKRLGRAV